MSTETTPTKKNRKKSVDEIVAELGKFTLTLRKPAKYEDVETSALSLDLDGLCGDDITEAFNDALEDEGSQYVPVPAMNTRCQAYVAAKAAKVPYGLIMKALHPKDFQEVTTKVMVFLVGS